ncbi:MAG: transcriptional repressor LexA [Bacillota bacterium]|nr:transcriptional repressor LexA [Bacillota bacterium]
MKKMTKSLQRTFDFIESCSQEGRYPTIREICAATGLKSTSTVHAQLRTLAEMGLVSRQDKLTRTVQVTGERFAKVPVLGRVTAGMPILAVEEIEGYVSISENIRRGRNLFALKIVGESMINAAILDGDIVIVDKTPVASNGQIVVALVGDEATVKTFYKEDGHFRLQPENPKFDPIIVPEVTILGQVISLIRNFS